MSLLDKVSLVVTPNAVKASKLYSVIPADGAGDLTATRSTTATRVNSLGLIESVAANVPRLNYDTAGGAPSILLEQQRTNLILQSGDLTNAYYSTGTAVVTANAGISPDGTNNAFKITRGGNNDNVFGGNYNPSIVLNHSRSIWAKTVSGTGQTSLCSHNSNTNNLFTITNVWQRFEVNTYNSTGANFMTIVDFRAAGNTLTEILIYEPQAEVGASASSNIPTTSAAVTRNQDLISKTGISDLIGQTEGVFFLETKSLSNDNTNRQISISDGTANNTIIIGYGASDNQLSLVLRQGSSTIFQSFPSITNALIVNKIALSYKSGNIGIFLNGVKIITNTSIFTYPSNTFTTLGFDFGNGANKYFGKLNDLQLYRTQLTDEECILLTSNSYASFELMAADLNYVTQ